jgi:hypothetical protein
MEYVLLLCPLLCHTYFCFMLHAYCVCHTPTSAFYAYFLPVLHPLIHLCFILYALSFMPTLLFITAQTMLYVQYTPTAHTPLHLIDALTALLHRTPLLFCRTTALLLHYCTTAALLLHYWCTAALHCTSLLYVCRYVCDSVSRMQFAHRP